MAKKAAHSLHALVEHIARQLTVLVTAEVQRRVKHTLASQRPAARLSKAAAPAPGARLCPVPGCGKAGKGPRNRYFCSEHARALSVEEQRSILARSQRLSANGKSAKASAAAKPSGPSFVRVPTPKERSSRPLDMSCRVEGCTNRSRGPRAGFICDLHRLELTPDEQTKARDAWNARKKAGPSLPLPAPVVVHAVPPIVRKPEPVASLETQGQQPA